MCPGLVDHYNEEISRLQHIWSVQQLPSQANNDNQLLNQFLDQKQLAKIDCFDNAQLASVIRTCQQSKSLADAGRTLFNISRTRRISSNDSHRLRVYLKKFGLEFKQIVE